MYTARASMLKSLVATADDSHVCSSASIISLTGFTVTTVSHVKVTSIPFAAPIVGACFASWVQDRNLNKERTGAETLFVLLESRAPSKQVMKYSKTHDQTTNSASRRGKMSDCEPHPPYTLVNQSE